MYKYIMKKNEGISRKTKHEISYEIINLFSNEKNIALLQIRSKIISHKCICIYIYILGLLPRPLVRVSDYMFFLFSIEITSCVSSANMPRPQCRRREIDRDRLAWRKGGQNATLWVYMDICISLSIDRRVYACLDFVCFCCKFAKKMPARIEFRVQVSYIVSIALSLSTYNVWIVSCYKTGQRGSVISQWSY